MMSVLTVEDPVLICTRSSAVNCHQSDNFSGPQCICNKEVRYRYPEFFHVWSRFESRSISVLWNFSTPSTLPRIGCIAFNNIAWKGIKLLIFCQQWSRETWSFKFKVLDYVWKLKITVKIQVWIIDRAEIGRIAMATIRPLYGHNTATIRPSSG